MSKAVFVRLTPVVHPVCQVRKWCLRLRLTVALWCFVVDVNVRPVIPPGWEMEMLCFELKLIDALRCFVVVRPVVPPVRQIELCSLES